MSPISIRLPLLAAIVVLLVIGGGTIAAVADAKTWERFPLRGHSNGVEVRYPGCNTWACVHRVRAKARARAMARFKANPMPRCTWHGESGAHLGEWADARYRAKNPISTAGGKFQIIDSTWYANGGRRYNVRHPAAAAPKIEQEKVARRVLRSQGLGAWVLC